jgi:hypothetical protein
MLISISARVTVPALRIRAYAGIENEITGMLFYSNPVEIREVIPVGTEFWGRVERGWICLKQGIFTYTNLRNFSWYVGSTNLYRVAAERWPELHGQTRPPNGGPLVQVASDSIKGGKYIYPLDKVAQDYIRMWNNARGYAKIVAPDVGPSQGIDPLTGRLKWNYLVWPSVTNNPNTLKVVETLGDWCRFETIPYVFPVAKDINPTATPWLFHKMCDNMGNPFIVDGAYIILPIFGKACWVPSRALIKL